ncbi:hypothetical protein QBC38DRAFT_355541 [Podospora fimiseda]|uniref:C2H2-type domain-containing protein n=1 Tax=Podospora fimiseda TaxID=252190 RepID=A0AAN7BX63_9PEZI|nr:hypothetical protein QBC38DRAFT_355541 [Podospora fimiseda]
MSAVNVVPAAGSGAVPPPPVTAPPQQQHHRQPSQPQPQPQSHLHHNPQSHPTPHSYPHPRQNPHPPSHLPPPPPPPQFRPQFHPQSLPHAQHDSSLESTIKHLMDQKEEIEAKLAILLPQKYGPNAKFETEMLRHKLRVLRAYAEKNQLSDKIPILSDIEEARALQYHCECIETACLEQGVDLHDPRFLDMLKRQYFENEAPEGYGQWLDRNINQYDPVAQAFRLRDSLPLSFRTHHSFKCADERCMHYIYGFPLERDRDQHVKDHVVPYKRDSALYVGDAPATAVSEQSSRSYGTEFNNNGKRPASPIHLAPIATGSQTRDHPNTLRSYSFVSEHPAGPRGSVDSEVDPLLPPLKRSRGVHPKSRLESIGELKLFPENGPCLRCRLFKEGCDSNDPCGFCAGMGGAPGNDVWKAIGCLRGPLGSLVEVIIPASISPRHPQTPIASPLATRRNMNEFLNRSFVVPPEIARMVKTHLDFNDGFWWTEDLASLPPTNPTLAFYSKEPADRPPPVLCALAASWNMNGTMYNFWQLMKLSAVISGNRETEAVRYPVLYRAKLLLREALFYDLQQHEPVIHGEPSSSTTLVASGDTDLHGRHQVLCSCAVQFLQAFDSQMTRSHSMEPKNWLAVFFSLCIFSIVKTLLVDRVTQLRVGSSAKSPAVAMQAAYRLLVDIFVTSTPALLDGHEFSMTADDRELLLSVNVLMGGSSWAQRGIRSTHDFLCALGTGASADGTFYNGFLKQRSLQRRESYVLPPVSKPAEATRKPLPTMRRLSNPYSPGQPGRDVFILKVELDTTVPPPLTLDLFRRHTVAESPSFSTQGGRRPTSPITAPPLRPTPTNSQQRPQVKRVFCGKCNEYPEGFRGEHELKRHTDAKHAPLVKRYICTEPVNLAATQLPTIPLKKCRACVSQKKYGAYYNAAAHLRRAHFNPQRGGKPSGDWPSMSLLKDWMREIEVQLHSAEAQEQDDSSDDEGQAFKTSHEFVLTPDSRPPMLVSGPPRLAPAPPPPLQHQATSNVLPQLAPSSSYERSPAPIPPPIIIQSTFPTPAPMLKGDDQNSPSTNGRSRCPHPECGRVFKDLTAHMLTHLEERPEKCPIVSCEYHTKGFARKYDKNRHALTHYKGTMICPFCPNAGTDFEKAFNRADVFKRHLTTVHNVEQTPPNSRKLIPTPGSSTRAGGKGARCSICDNYYANAQEFYEHLDECVLNVIVPSAATPQTTLIASRNGSMSERSRSEKGKEVDRTTTSDFRYFKVEDPAAEESARTAMAAMQVLENEESRQAEEATLPPPPPPPPVEQQQERKQSTVSSVPDSPLSPPPENIPNPYLDFETQSETVSEIQVTTGPCRSASYRDEQMDPDEADEEEGGPPQQQLNPRPFLLPKVTLGSPIPPDGND